MPQLIVENLVKAYPTRSKPLRVLEGVSLELGTGESLAIVGPSGSGKSTLLQILGTLDQPTEGTVTFDGEDPFALSEKELAKFRNQRIGFIFQDHHLLPQLSVLENVLVPTLAQGKASADQVARAHELIDRVGLSDRITHRPAELSGGERQRVATARSLIHQPDLILADEPTGNLDRTTAQQISLLLLELQQQEGTLLIVVSHSQDVARQMQSQYELNEGKLVTSGG